MTRLLVGMVTDRDIVLRGVARGCPADRTPLTDVMSDSPRWCYEDQTLEDASRLMSDAQIRRLPVVDRDRTLVGIVSLGDLAQTARPGMSGETLEEISEPSKLGRSPAR